MSKQSEAKLAQGYTPPNTKICQLCKYFKKEVTPQEKITFHCGLGNFAVVKTAVCNKFQVVK